MSDALTIIIPTYNRCELLDECLTSIEEQTGAAIKVLVVDDGSEEDVAAYLKEHFMGVDVIRNDENQGFAATVNIGLRAAKTDYVMLLNNDMTLESECIERMMSAMVEQEVDMVAPLVVWKDDPDTIYSAGDKIGINGRPESFGFRVPRKDFEFPDMIFGVSAGAAIYKKAVFDDVGLLDERFVAYFEDADLCFRARLAGFRAGLAKDAVARHVGSASQFGATWWRSRQCYRNFPLLVMKNMPFSLLVKHFFPIKLELLHQTLRVISSARVEFGLAKALLIWLKAMSEWTFLMPGIFVDRWRIQRSRKVSPLAIEHLLSRDDD
jgi:GT2 family glycosyltransferase